MSNPSPAEIRRLQDAQERLFDNLDSLHSERLEIALETLEGEIEKVVGSKDITPSEAIKKRAPIENAMQSTFLTWADESVRDYDQLAASVIAMMQTLGSIEGFESGDAEIINQLKRIAFAGYQDVANRFIDTLANGLYQSAVAGRPNRETVKEMRQAINGVFAKTDDDAAMELIDFVKRFRDDPRRADDVAKAAETLRTKFGRDRAGNNLRRYAYQQMHDGINQFSRSFTQATAQRAGLTHYEYYGSLIRDSRDWCVRHVGKVMSIEEIREEWASNDWKGKSPGDPLIVVGGYNCRHHFFPVEPEWFEGGIDDEGFTDKRELFEEDFKELNPERAEELNL